MSGSPLFGTKVMTRSESTAAPSPTFETVRVAAVPPRRSNSIAKWGRTR
jgi:hypothetical protein